MTKQQFEFHRFLMRLATDIAYRHEVLPHEVEVLRTIEQYVKREHPEAGVALLYLCLAVSDAELQMQEPNPFAAIEAALRIACAVGALQQLSRSSTTEEGQPCSSTTVEEQQ
jgi:hypothetical protein